MPRVAYSSPSVPVLRKVVAFLNNAHVGRGAAVSRSASRSHADEAMRGPFRDARLWPMIWAILASLGVPLWLCAAGICMLLVNNRRLRKRYGDVPVRVRRTGKKRWTRGHAVWVSDVFAWRGSPAAWAEELLAVRRTTPRDAEPDERKKLHSLGDPVIVTLTVDGGEPVDVAVAREQSSALLGPFARPNGTDVVRKRGEPPQGS